MAADKPDTRQTSRNARVALLCGCLVASMVGMAYAAVPLYRIFCQVTGYGGTTQVADATSATIIERKITIRFDANVSPDMDWSFKPVQKAVELKVGETGLAFYRAVSRSSRDTMGTATFNVTPLAAGAYFNKIDCFCFTEQKLKAGQTVDMPVTFFVDPEIDQDPDLTKLTEITLSYTFYPIEDDETETEKVSDSGKDVKQGS